ncbi:MAG: FAD-dependent oxidoreductase [Gemmatimonadota bacterium]
MSEPRVVILGGGPAGVGAAQQLRKLGRASVTLLEQGSAFGGNAGSFENAGQRLDFGSHRLHPACEPAILEDIRRSLNGDLLDRPRHGRIRLRGRWIHFPLKPVDLVLRLDPGFALGTLRDMAGKAISKRPEGDTFASVLQANLGTTICDNFYFPYARKIWGRAPEELSGIQARRRVSAGSFGKLIKKVLTAVPGLKPPGSGRFFYPRRGFGQISETYAEQARSLGADLRLGYQVTQLVPPKDSSTPWLVRAKQRDAAELVTFEADYLWSTIPITVLARAMEGGVPPAVLTAAAGIEYRAMMLIYLELPVESFTEYDAHYFPDAAITITRLSEPKNYSDLREPKGRTTICAELPCAVDDAQWKMDDAALGRVVADDLARAGIPLPCPPASVQVRRLRQAYPIYVNGYEHAFGTLDHWVEGLPRLLSYGRQGLFAHDNTHHALYMAYCAAQCLTEKGFDSDRWAEYRKVFATHVVED